MNIWRGVNHLCCYVMLLWAFLPVLGAYQSSLIFQIPFLASMAVWVITGIALMSKKSRIRCLALFVPFVLIMYFYVFIEYGNLNVPTSFDYALLFGFVVNCIYYIEHPDQRFCKRTLQISLFLIIVTAVTTLLVLMVDENASRTLTSSSSDANIVQLYKRLNVGSFDYIYGIVIILPMLVFYTNSVRNKIKALSLWLVVALLAFVVVKSNFTTALMLLFVDFVFILLSGRRFKSNSSFILTFSVLILFSAFLLSYFIDFMIQMSESLYSQSKLEGILGVINGEETYADTTSRSELLEMSIMSFIESPIWGVGAWYGGGAPHVGQHAQFVDDMARYGLIGAMPLMGLVFYGVKRIYNAFDEKYFYNRKVLASLLVLFALGFMNPIYSPGLLASVFVVVPFLDNFLYE